MIIATSKSMTEHISLGCTENTPLHATPNAMLFLKNSNDPVLYKSIKLISKRCNDTLGLTTCQDGHPFERHNHHHIENWDTIDHSNTIHHYKKTSFLYNSWISHRTIAKVILFWDAVWSETTPIMTSISFPWHAWSCSSVRPAHV